MGISDAIFLTFKYKTCNSLRHWEDFSAIPGFNPLSELFASSNLLFYGELDSAIVFQAHDF